ncbi:hypothetical protein [Microbacterium paraoxydans]|uniref:hypothetical protein n=1 Tax=Microbacterium paraoxydans TaxID=199592 RepID=UPI003D744549
MHGGARRELTGWLAALAIALVAAGQLAATPRSELLFRDGDSLVVALIGRAVLGGDGVGEWALSSVLFLPETAVHVVLAALLPLGVNGLLAVNAVVNLLGFYGVARLVAGRRGAGSAPVAWSLAAFGAFALLVLTESSSSRDALELASLQLTTTYYAATVIGVVAVIGLARRFLDRARGRVALLVTLGATAAVSTLSNPLFAVWATVPLLVVLGALALSPAPRRRVLLLAVVLLSGTALGFLGRIPFAAWIANTGAGYVQPWRWAESLRLYAGLFAERLSTLPGVLAVAAVVALLCLAVVRSVREREPGARLVAAVAWVAPVLVLLGAVALGTQAARYLQPLAFVPVLALVADPRVLRSSGRAVRVVVAATGALLLVAGGLSVPRLAAAAQAPDADLACVTDWVDASGRTGAGQFWTVRLPKLHLADPSRLVQVDHALNGYAWLVDRRDFAVGEVSFLVEDAQTVPWQLPAGAGPFDTVECGRYRILDFGETPLRLGPAHS